ncbi:unnamed protein product [Ostreobium quekettii]|uniref:Protein kinase domain-containing protein n=1 Tax=Ostreobium quekettii TaxID=121088 RepID=A0A8S1J686_9CHLO|nr:unnamed protein product [Ostreobium quekettii]|eukprot:evm.model.scf_359.7 EVM.evm.TU.scf_359.7   scf_359:38674-44342(-)
MAGRSMFGQLCRTAMSPFVERIDTIVGIAREELPNARYHVKMLEFLFLEMEKFEGLHVMESGSPMSETLQMWKCVEDTLKSGRTLIRRHAGRLDLKDFYRTSEVKSKVEEICNGLRMAAEVLTEKGYLSQEMETIRTELDAKLVSTDRSYLYHYLSYVMEGAQSALKSANVDPNGSAQAEWKQVKAEHDARVTSLPIITNEGRDKVDLVEPIGSSNSSTVHRGRWRNIDVAVKKFAYGQFSQEALASFYTEVEIQRSMSYPHIVRIYAVSKEGLMVMELAKYNLHEMYAQHANLEWATKAKILLEAARGVKFVHDQGIVHRDIKSLNFLVFDQVTGGFIVKIADFGLATVKTETRSRTGRPQLAASVWAAPEVCKGKMPNFRSDVFSLGVVMFEVLAQCLPYEGISSHDLLLGQKRRGVDPCKVPSDCPAFLLTLMRKCISPRPTQRPSMSAVLEGLKVLQAQFPEGGQKRSRAHAGLVPSILRDAGFRVNETRCSDCSNSIPEEKEPSCIGTPSVQDARMIPSQDPMSSGTIPEGSEAGMMPPPFNGKEQVNPFRLVSPRGEQMLTREQANILTQSFDGTQSMVGAFKLCGFGCFFERRKKK